MTPETLKVMYTCFVVGGFVIPVLNVAIGTLSSALGADTDIDTNVDADLSADVSGDTPGDVSGGHMKIPVNLMSLSLSAVIFGALGRLLLTKVSLWLGFYIAIQSAILAGFLLGRFVILPLKRNRAFATSVRHMVGARGRVTLEMRADFIGTVELRSATGSQVTYSARPVEGVAIIRVGETVSVVEVNAERMLCIVRPLEDNETEK